MLRHEVRRERTHRGVRGGVGECGGGVAGASTGQRDVGAGEVVFVDMAMQMHTHVDALAQPLRPCIFEYVYLARPDSVMDNISVYEARVQMGVRLAARVRRLRVKETGERVHVVDEGDEGYEASLPKLEDLVDVVMAVPDTSRHTALSIATTLGKRYIEGLSKNRYIARTFIMPAQELRQKSIRIKHNPIHDAVKGLSVLVVDDSIVRGNTTMMLVSAIRAAAPSTCSWPRRRRRSASATCTASTCRRRTS